MKTFVGVALFLAGCYSPKLGTPGFYCHPGDEPACPDGQVCVDGRCRDRGTAGVRPDGGVGGGGAGDLGATGDGGGKGGGDMATRPGTLGCKGYVECLVACTSPSCADDCDAKTSLASVDLYQMALSCGQQHCIDRGYCTIDAAGTMLIDAPGAAGQCNPCLENATASLFNATCTGTFNCNPPQCAGVVQACKDDLP